MELVALAHRGFARRDVDPGWSGSHIGRSVGWSFDTPRDARIERRASRCERDVYLAGAVIGALLFGYGTDRFGRKKLFFITVAVYLIGTALSGFSWNFWSYALFRAITGAGIGGEYAAINSAIDELIPARVRGRVDLIINGSYWVGAAMGAAATLVLLDPRYIPIWLGWRCAFGIGATLGLIVIFFRRWIPESPRWLMIHGRNRRSGRDRCGRGTKDSMARAIRRSENAATAELFPTRIRTRTHTPWREIWNAIVHEHRRRSFLGFVLMSTQAFFYNAIFFTYALVLMRFYGVPEQDVGGYLLPFALGNVLGPLLLGHLFDTIGRKQMITLTYALAGSIARGDWLAFSRRIADRANANACVDNYLFRRFGGRQFRLPDRERDFSLGNSRNGDRNFLCSRNTGRRRRRAAAVRLDHRHGIEHSIIHGIFGGCGVDDFCGGNGSMDRRGRRATLARAHRRTVVEQRAVICSRVSVRRVTLVGQTHLVPRFAQRSGYSSARRSETAATVNGKFASMNWPRRRQVAGIKMERVDTDHSSIELGIRL